MHVFASWQLADSNGYTCEARSLCEVEQCNTTGCNVLLLKVDVCVCVILFYNYYLINMYIYFLSDLTSPTFKILTVF